MKQETYTLKANLPSIEEYSDRFPKRGNFARGEGNFLFELIMTAENFNYAQTLTHLLGLPAATAVAEICFQAWSANPVSSWGYSKQFIGTVICSLMEANGFEKTGKKRSIPHAEFSVGEVYRPSNT